MILWSQSIRVPLPSWPLIVGTPDSPWEMLKGRNVDGLDGVYIAVTSILERGSAVVRKLTNSTGSRLGALQICCGSYRVVP